jgi:hypothetical protein
VKATPPCQKNSLGIGGNQALQGDPNAPKVDESKSRGVIASDVTTSSTTSTTSTTTSTLASTDVTWEKDVWNFDDDFGYTDSDWTKTDDVEDNAAPDWEISETVESDDVEDNTASDGTISETAESIDGLVLVDTVPDWTYSDSAEYDVDALSIPNDTSLLTTTPPASSTTTNFEFPPFDPFSDYGTGDNPEIRAKEDEDMDSIAADPGTDPLTVFEIEIAELVKLSFSLSDSELYEEFAKHNVSHRLKLKKALKNILISGIEEDDTIEEIVHKWKQSEAVMKPGPRYVHDDTHDQGESHALTMSEDESQNFEKFDEKNVNDVLFMFSHPNDDIGGKKNNESTDVKNLQSQIKLMVNLMDMVIKSKGDTFLIVAKTNNETVGDYMRLLQDIQKDIAMFNQTQSDDITLFNTTVIDKIDDIMNMLVSKEQFGYLQLYNALNSSGLEELKKANGSSIIQMQLEALKKQILEQSGPGIGGRSTKVGNATSITCDPSTSLNCTDGFGCYLINEKCNRWEQCFDKSDEADCTCVDYQKPFRLCDGYPDCPYGEDEIGCECFAGDQFNCGYGQDDDEDDEEKPNCIDVDLRCDNYIDCQLSNDEVNCFTLNSEVVKDTKRFPRQHTKGLLHIQRANEWRLLVVDPISETEKAAFLGLANDMAAEACMATITRKQNTPIVKMVPFGPNNDSVAHLQVDVLGEDRVDKFYPGFGRFTFDIKAYNTTSHAFEVDCGLPKCGQPVKNENGPFALLSQSTTKQRPVNASKVKIVGGEDTKPNLWPFALSLHRNGQFVCGATIINANWILTAGHCVMDFKEKNDQYQVWMSFYFDFDFSSAAH